MKTQNTEHNETVKQTSAVRSTYIAPRARLITINTPSAILNTSIEAFDEEEGQWG